MVSELTHRPQSFLLLVKRRQVQDEGGHEQQEGPLQREQDEGADQPGRGRYDRVRRRHD